MDQQAELNFLLHEAAQQIFDLEQGPLLRANLYQLTDTEHILLINFHHIITDGWSMDIWWSELNIHYQAAINSESIGLPALPLQLQYVDFAQWQRSWLKDAILNQQLAYWQQQLADAPTLIDLPTDYPRPRVETFNGQVERFEIRPQLATQLRALTHRFGVSLFMTAYAAFAVLLARYSRQEDLVIGTLIANRHYRDVESLIGFFVNTLPLRTDLSGNPIFVELLERIRRITLDASSHQDIPFEQVVEHLSVERHMSHAPVFQVMFSFEPPPAAKQLGPLQVEPLELPTVTSKFDFIWLLKEADDRLEGRIEYNDLFAPATIQRFISHFQQLLAEIVAVPEQLVYTLPLLTEAERHQMLVAWNNTQTAYPEHTSIPALFEAQVARTAVVFQEHHLTYRALNQRANQLAHYLQSLGVGPETLVGLCIERSPEMVVGLVGILKAGGAYLPLDPDDPQARIVYMLEDSRAPVLLTQQRLLPDLPIQSVQRVCLDTDWPAIATYRQDNPTTHSGPDHLAYVMYTSGSTGNPKGVAIPHRGINRLVNHTNYIHLTASDRISQLSNVSFDAATFEIWGALLHGAQLVGISREMALSPHRLADQL